MTLSDLDGHFAVYNLFNSHISVKYTICLHTNWKVYVVCNLNCRIESEGHLKVAGSHVHCKSGNILETVLDRDVVTTDHYQEVIYRPSLLNSAIFVDLE